MKKIILSICLLAIGTAVLAQSVRVGVKGAYNSTWLFNKNVSDHGPDLDYVSTFGSSFGASLNINFVSKIGVSLDLLTSSHNQDYKGTYKDTTGTHSWTASEKFKYFDIPVLFRISDDKGPYGEIGPQFSFLTGSKENYSSSITSVSKDYKSNYNSMCVSAVLGFGYDIEASANLNIGLGFRFAYSLSDVTKEMSASQLASSSDNNSLLTDVAQYPASGTGLSYAKTNRATGGFMISLMFKP